MEILSDSCLAGQFPGKQSMQLALLDTRDMSLAGVKASSSAYPIETRHTVLIRSEKFGAWGLIPASPRHRGPLYHSASKGSQVC